MCTLVHMHIVSYCEHKHVQFYAHGGKCSIEKACPNAVQMIVQKYLAWPQIALGWPQTDLLHMRAAKCCERSRQSFTVSQWTRLFTHSIYHACIHSFTLNFEPKVKYEGGGAERERELW